MWRWYLCDVSTTSGFLWHCCCYCHCCQHLWALLPLCTQIWDELLHGFVMHAEACIMASCITFRWSVSAWMCTRLKSVFNVFPPPLLKHVPILYLELSSSVIPRPEILFQTTGNSNITTVSAFAIDIAWKNTGTSAWVHVNKGYSMWSRPAVVSFTTLELIRSVAL